MKRRVKHHRRKIGLLIGLVLLLASIGGAYKLVSHSATATVQALLAAQVTEETADWLKLEGQGVKKTPTLIFYQGAFVEAAAYGTWATELAQQGYDVYLLKAPFSLPILRPALAEKVLTRLPNEDFVLGGHSLGGVAASRFAATLVGDDSFRGVFFLGSYPDEEGSLAAFKGSVLSVTGELDGVLNQERYQSGKDYLPESTQYVTIQGGNHAGFGSYGTQRGDGEATLSNGAQQERLAAYLSEWLGGLGDSPSF